MAINGFPAAQTLRGQRRDDCWCRLPFSFARRQKRPRHNGICAHSAVQARACQSGSIWKKIKDKIGIFAPIFFNFPRKINFGEKLKSNRSVKGFFEKIDFNSSQKTVFRKKLKSNQDKKATLKIKCVASCLAR